MAGRGEQDGEMGKQARKEEEAESWTFRGVATKRGSRAFVRARAGKARCSCPGLLFSPIYVDALAPLLAKKQCKTAAPCSCSFVRTDPGGGRILLQFGEVSMIPSQRHALNAHQTILIASGQDMIC